MANYFVTGKLGAGKTLCAVGRIQDHLFKNLRVATNLNLNLDVMLGPKWEDCDVTRVPDKPDVTHLEQLGFGCEEEDYSEEKFGLLVLDELGTWFNSRSWNEKGRKEIINFLLHLRKLRWHGMFIVQDIDMVDAQLRASLGEHLVICKRLDRLRIPFIGWFLSWFGPIFNHGKMPKVHVALVYYGQSTSVRHVERWVYRGSDLYKAYETGQRFTDGMDLIGDQWHDGRGNHRYIPPMQTHGIFLVPKTRIPLHKYLLLPLIAVSKLVSRLSGCKPDRWLISYGLKKPTEPIPVSVRDYFLPVIDRRFAISERSGNIYYVEVCQR